MESKPLKAKPHFYACCFPQLQKIAHKLGYNLIVHGSLNRDMDLIAVPWVDKPATHYRLISSMDKWLRGVSYQKGMFERGYMYSKLPGGRSSYIINLNRGGRYNNYTDEQYYLDISITPLQV